MLKGMLGLKPLGAALVCPIRRPGLKTRLNYAESTDQIQKWALKTIITSRSDPRGDNLD
jgi:hypothetical protein